MIIGRKYIIVMQVLGCAIIKGMSLICYLYLNNIDDIGYWRLLFGGIEVANSKYILNVVFQTFSDFLFYNYVSSKYLKQLKENYIYIFIREKNMKRWLRKFQIVSFVNVIIYEIITAIILFFAGLVLQENMSVRSTDFIIMFLCQFVKLATIIIFCNILLFRFNETIAVYANLFIQTLPLFLVGVLYDINGAWGVAVKFIPANWCNLNYLIDLKINPLLMLGISMVLCVGLYGYFEKIFKAYEII